MSKEYDDITAYHYASYRPTLHKPILQERFGNKSFDSALDIGCGTGQSTIALIDFCKTAVGIDPSVHMLSKGIIHPNVSYSHFDNNRIDFEDNTFDIVTLAGSLWYAKSQGLLDEIVRVTSENSLVLVYDFEVLLKEVLTAIGFETNSADSIHYNHQEDFSGLALERIQLLAKGSERVELQITSNDLAHLILSVKGQYNFLAKAYGSVELYEKTVVQLNTITDLEVFDIKANTFFTSYRIS